MKIAASCWRRYFTYITLSLTSSWFTGDLHIKRWWMIERAHVGASRKHQSSRLNVFFVCYYFFFHCFFLIVIPWIKIQMKFDKHKKEKRVSSGFLLLSYNSMCAVEKCMRDISPTVSIGWNIHLQVHTVRVVEEWRKFREKIKKN